MLVDKPVNTDLRKCFFIPSRHIPIIFGIQLQAVFMVAVAIINRILLRKLRKKSHRHIQCCLRLRRQHIPGDQDHVRSDLVDRLQESNIFFSVSLIVQIRQNHCLHRLFDSLIPQGIMPHHKAVTVVQHYPQHYHKDYCDHGNHYIQLFCPHGMLPDYCQFVL